MKDSDTLITTTLDLAGLLADQRERAERAEADLAHGEQGRRQLVSRLEAAEREIADLRLQRAGLPPETDAEKTLRRDVQALQEKLTKLTSERDGLEDIARVRLGILNGLREILRVPEGVSITDHACRLMAERDPSAGKPGPGADLLTWRPVTPEEPRAGLKVLTWSESWGSALTMRMGGGWSGEGDRHGFAPTHWMPLPPKPAAVPPPPPAAPEAHPALCTVGDLKPGERAMAVDDLRNFVGHLELERGTLIEADSKERDPALSEAAIRRVLVSSDRLDPRVYFVMKTGCVRRTGAARPAPAPAVEVRGATLVVDGKEHPKAPPGADRFPIEPAGAERCAYDALQPDPARCPDVRSTLELLDAAVNALPEGPAREAVTLARLQWRDGDRVAALARLEAIDVTENSVWLLRGHISAAMHRMAADLQHDGTAAKGAA